MGHPIKAGVPSQKLMSKRIIKFETLDYSRVKYVSPFSDISSVLIGNFQGKKIIADL